MTRKILPFFIGVSIVFFIFTGVSFSEEKMSNADCLTCHSDKDLEAETERGKKLNLFVPANPMMGSVHESLTCVECHTGEKSFDEIPHSAKPMTKGCINCHEDAVSPTNKDIHSKAIHEGNERAPECWSCHGAHQVKPLSSLESVVSKKKQPDTCGKCHGDDSMLTAEKGITKRNLVSRYKTSVHWEAITQGKNAASCTDCHGKHNILSSNAPESTVSRTGLVAACNKCHPNEARSFWSGAHGAALLHGNHDVPTCTTCHGDHDMASLKLREGDAKQWASTQVCMWCHGNARMMKRYGLDTAPVDTYMNDFHGLTQRGTLGASATCADCHDPHHSLPADHPSSRMHITNRGPTCGKCHGKVSDSFAQSFSHKAKAPKDGLEVEKIIRVLYILLIVFAVAFMLFYNFIIWFKAVRDKIKAQRALKHINRMNKFERTSHMLLFISFTILVITGFALKYPEAWWAKFLFAIGINESIRAFIHRTAAMVMTIDFGIFLMYMFLAKRGKCMMKEMLPKVRDIHDFFELLKYYLGIKKGDHPPKQPVFGFVEKFEFWALVWGTIVMVISGLILWFPKAIPGSWPAWILNVARTIHYYEALLATLAIIIWHGFHTMFHPHEYPMNTSWITGYISEPDAKGHFSDEAIKKMKK